jgi:hypothetical protein
MVVMVSEKVIGLMLSTLLESPLGSFMIGTIFPMLKFVGMVSQLIIKFRYLLARKARSVLCPYLKNSFYMPE